MFATFLIIATTFMIVRNGGDSMSIYLNLITNYSFIFQVSAFSFDDVYNLFKHGRRHEFDIFY